MKKIYIKYKQIILYLLFGILTTIINIVGFNICVDVFHIEYKISNIIAWIISVVFAFITNKILVFESKSIKGKIFRKEILSFIGVRLFSLFIDMTIMIVFIDIIGVSKNIAKIVANIVVIILNYILSKLIVFKKEK